MHTFLHSSTLQNVFGVIIFIDVHSESTEINFCIGIYFI